MICFFLSAWVQEKIFLILIFILIFNGILLLAVKKFLPKALSNHTRLLVVLPLIMVFLFPLPT